MTINYRPIGVDLFAGAGGMTLGFEQAGFDVLAGVEIDPIHCATHEFNFPFWQILCRDITNLSAQEIRALSSIGDHPIDVVFGGPPCQGFSLIGKRVLDDPRNALVFHFCRLVLELQPKFFVMENVPGMTIGNHSLLLEEIINLINTNGYQVIENYQILNAAHYGVPQKRSRLFIIGCRQELSLPNYPLPRTSFDSKSDPTLPSTPTVADAIADLPNIDNYPELLTRDWEIVDYGKASHYASILRGLTSIDDDYSYARDYDSTIITSSLRTRHSPPSMARFKSTKPGNREPISRFYRLANEGLSNTLRAGTDRNHGGFTSPRPIHPIYPRCITVREAARLHSYPDWFRFHVTKWHGFRQVGNSVPPLLAKAIATEIIKNLGINTSKPTITYELGKSQLLQFNSTQAQEHYQLTSSPP